MPAYILAFLLPALWATTNILDQKISHRLNLHITSIMIICASLQLFIMLPIFAIIFTPSWPTFQQLPFTLAIGLLDLLYLIPYYAALRHENTSVVASLFKLGLVVVPVLSFLTMGEVLAPLQYAGVFIILCAGMAVSMKPARYFHLGPAFWLMLLSAFITSSNSVLTKYATADISWDTLYIWSQAFSAIVVLSTALVPKVRRVLVYEVRKAPTVLRLASIEQAISATAEAGSFYVLSQIPVTIAKAIGAIQPFYALFFAWIMRHHLVDFFHESLEKRAVRRKLIYFTLMCFGLWLVLFGAPYDARLFD